MKRKDAINHIKFAGYHNDIGTGQRLYIENRISWETYRKAMYEGIQAKKNGMKCNCYDCTHQTEQIAKTLAPS